MCARTAYDGNNNGPVITAKYVRNCKVDRLNMKTKKKNRHKIIFLCSFSFRMERWGKRDREKESKKRRNLLIHWLFLAYYSLMNAFFFSICVCCACDFLEIFCGYFVFQYCFQFRFARASRAQLYLCFVRFTFIIFKLKLFFCLGSL